MTHLVSNSREYQGWQAIAGGSSNQLYLSPDKQQVLRCNAPPPLTFGVDRQREAHILELIQPYPWSVQVIDNQVDQGYCLLRAYQPIATTKPLAAAQQQQLLAAIATWQTIPLSANPVWHISYPTLLQSYQEALPRHPDAPAWIKAFLSHWQALPQLPTVLVHHDLHPGNLCLDGEQLIVLDWEYAGFGNPWFDAVGLCRGCGIQADAIKALPIFAGLTQNQWELGLMHALEAAAYLDRLWFAVREMAG